MTTLRQMKEEGWSITLYCLSASGPPCHHSWKPSWDQLIQYFGQDFVLSGDRAPFSRLVCEVCGGRGASVIAQANDRVTHRSIGGHANHAPEMTDEQAAEAERAFMTDFRAQGFKTIAERNAESRAKLKAERKTARAGDGLIGPPNPWGHRKRGRWL